MSLINFFFKFKVNECVVSNCIHVIIDMMIQILTIFSFLLFVLKVKIPEFLIIYINSRKHQHKMRDQQVKKTPVMAAAASSRLPPTIPIDDDDDDDQDETREYSHPEQEDESPSSDAAQSGSTSASDLMSAKFNKLLVALINIYDKWTQPMMSGNETTTAASFFTPGVKLDECLARIDRLNMSDLSRADLFACLVELLDRLIEFLFNCKRDHFTQLYAFFKNTNLLIIQFYEFVNRIMSSMMYFESGSSSTKGMSAREARSILLGKSFELIHVLISSKSK